MSTYITVDGAPVGTHPLMKKFMKGVFQLRPALPRNEVTWDTSVVLDYLRRQSPVRSLDLKKLTFKLVMLLALLTGQRCQTLHAITLDNLTLTKNHLKLRFRTLLKHSRPGKHLAEITIKGYAPDRRTCVTTVLAEYLLRTRNLRHSNQLFLSYMRPHKPVTKDTIARWVKTVLVYSGIDTNIFTAHSTRAAATTKAKLRNVPLGTILKTAGWSSDKTFAKYYDKSAGGVDMATAIQN